MFFTVIVNDFATLNSFLLPIIPPIENQHQQRTCYKLLQNSVCNVGCLCVCYFQVSIVCNVDKSFCRPHYSFFTSVATSCARPPIRTIYFSALWTKPKILAHHYSITSASNSGYAYSSSFLVAICF